MRVRLYPNWDEAKEHGESGIKTVIRAYSEILPRYGITLTDDNPDVVVVNAGSADFPIGKAARVAMCHGLYWSEGYTAPSWQHKTNQVVLASIRAADLVTVPSPWVARTFQRDMHLDPVVIPHGIDVQAWDDSHPGTYVLWNKNRNTDACDPLPVHKLAWQRADLRFVTTFSSPQVTDPQKNVTVVGPQPHARMKELVEHCSVYLSTTKETFGIGILEAMACFPGETKVSAKDVLRVTRKLYTGKLITIRTDTATIRATAEHPFWTNQGWVSAIELTKMHRILYCSGYASTQEVHTGTIEEVYRDVQNHVRARDCRRNGYDTQGSIRCPVRHGSTQEVPSISYSEAAESNGSPTCLPRGNYRRRGNRYPQTPRQKDETSYSGGQHVRASWRLVDEMSSVFRGISYLCQKQAERVFHVSYPGHVIFAPVRSADALSGYQEGQDAFAYRMVSSEIGTGERGEVYAKTSGDFIRNSPPEYQAIQEIAVSDVTDLPVYNFTTKSSVYLAEGYLVHNCGRPILGYREGNITELVTHGVNGYLAEPGRLDDLLVGLDYCMEHAADLGANGRVAASAWTWENVATKLVTALEQAVTLHAQPHTVSVVIPCYNKVATLERAVISALVQTRTPEEVIIVDNNSTDGSFEEASRLMAIHPTVRVVVCKEQGVAHARNLGIAEAHTRYVCCLDADDEIASQFLQACVSALEQDPALGLAYTRLTAVDETHEAVSQWPGAYDYDKFLVRQNQVPTCCVFRRDLALRLGGYRQRYAPDGAGAEDAEFWLRMGAAGYAGKLASEHGFFRYHLGGAVSANPNYHETDWLAWHPWVTDKRHPCASCARPANGMAHPVRAYDRPQVSVIIPCAPAHLSTLTDALDSLEAQSMRNWEAIVVFDGPDIEAPSKARLRLQYPFITPVATDRALGAGAARNLGAAQAHSDFLLFLDADDWLQPNALDALFAAYNQNVGSIIYGDYYGHATVDDPSVFGDRLKDYHVKSKRAVILHHAFDYDCAEAVRQPHINEQGEFYIWNLVSSLVPKSYHEAIGGFDEAMPSWEDWDYWIRMAKAGYCFTRLNVPLVSYRFATGARRELGRQQHAALLDYLTAKYRSIPTMPCRSCGGARPKPPPIPIRASRESINTMNANEMVEVTLVDGNKGDHPVMINGTNYGYRSDGDIFLMKYGDATAFPRRFRINGAPAPEPAAAPPPPAPPAPPPPPPPPKAGKKGDEAVEPAVNWNFAVKEGPSIPPEDLPNVQEGPSITPDRVEQLLHKRERKPRAKSSKR